MIKEYIRIWPEVVMAYFHALFHHLPLQTEGSAKNLGEANK
jgi:hypothetical protein